MNNFFQKLGQNLEHVIPHFEKKENEYITKVTQNFLQSADSISNAALHMSGYFERIAGDLGFLKEKALQAYHAGANAANPIITQPTPHGLLPTIKAALQDTPAVGCGIVIGAAATLLTVAVGYGIHTLLVNREAKSNPHTQLNFAPQPESQLQPVYYQISNDGEEVYYEDEDWPEVDPIEVKGEER